jgi:hypothetical protein
VDQEAVDAAVAVLERMDEHEGERHQRRRGDRVDPRRQTPRQLADSPA